MTYDDGDISLPIRTALRDGEVTILGEVVGVGPGVDTERGWPVRDAEGCDGCRQAASLAAENERLRALIGAWADTEDELDGVCSSRFPVDLVHTMPEVEARHQEAHDALRAAVRR